VALPKNISRRLLSGVLLGVVIYLGIVLWADASKVGSALRHMPLWVLPVACALSLLNYMIRFWKWQRYLQLLNIDIERRASWLVYLSGFALSVTPGKLGEVFKSFLLKRIAGTPIHTSAPIVIAERFTDLLAYLILIALGGRLARGERRGRDERSRDSTIRARCEARAGTSRRGLVHLQTIHL
jgi:uncharacterized membrane protein YbhN (UPF0104 family)